MNQSINGPVNQPLTLQTWNSPRIRGFPFMEYCISSHFNRPFRGVGWWGSGSCKPLNVNAAAFLIWFHLQRKRVSFSFSRRRDAVRDISEAKLAVHSDMYSMIVERRGKQKFDDIGIKKIFKKYVYIYILLLFFVFKQLEMGTDEEGGRRGEAFSVYEEDSHPGCSMLYFMPPRSQLLQSRERKI